MQQGKEKKTVILVYLKDEEEKRKIKALAAQKGLPMNEMLLAPFRDKNI